MPAPKRSPLTSCIGRAPYEPAQCGEPINNGCLHGYCDLHHDNPTRGCQAKDCPGHALRPAPQVVLERCMRSEDRGPAWVSKQLRKRFGVERTPQSVALWKSGARSITPEIAPLLEQLFNLAPGTLLAAGERSSA